MPSTAQLTKDFTKIFGSLARHQHRYETFTDFLELATCAIRKTTLPPGDQADQLEARYMAVVKRHKADDIRTMPELLGITTLALQDGGCDFLGRVAGELELLNGGMGQFFTPYDLSRMMAEMQLADAGPIIEAKGFITVAEPACGAGGMILAVADVLTKQGHDIGTTLYADGTDLSEMCFRMAYIQTSLRGVPAMIRRGNTLSLEMFDQARTPALLPFLLRHGDPFRQDEAESSASIAAATVPEPPRPAGQPTTYRTQLGLFDFG